MPRVVEKDIEVRWGDLDAFGHVNNTHFLRYLEEARIVLFRGLGVAYKNREFGPVVVNVNCNFRREITYPTVVRVRLEATVASDRRLVLQHAMTDRDQPETLYADAEITVVWVDSASGRSIPIPSSVRLALENGDG